MRLVFLLLSFVVGSAVAADGSQPNLLEPGAQEMPRVVMARVGSTEITVEAFMQFLAKHPSRLPESTTVEGKANLLRTMIGNELLIQALRAEAGLSEDATEADQQQAYAQLEARHFPLSPVPDDAALRAYYDAHRAEFGIPASVRLTQIQLRVDEKASAEAKAVVRERAEAALKRVEAGESFAKIAGELTENPNAKDSMGDVGFVWRYGNEWLENALQGLKIGDHTRVLESPVGYDILLVTDAREAIQTPFEDAREAVAQQMQTEQQNAARAAYIRALADQIGVEILLPEIKDAFSNGVFPADSNEGLN